MIFLKIIHEEECFVNESVEKPAIYDLLFLIAIYYPKNDRKYPSEMRISMTDIFLVRNPFWRQV